MSDLPRVQLYCDGSCLRNPGPGGWAALLIFASPRSGEQERRKLVQGGCPDTTNNRMELTAAIEGLSALKQPCDARVFCDSQYVVRGMSEWQAAWRRRGWKTAGGKRVENVELWQRLVQAASPHRATWHWVKGHAGHPLNEYVDEQARQQAQRFLRG
ncbi:MAG: ribonuclease HI [Myxococcota bacterium]